MNVIAQNVCCMYSKWAFIEIKYKYTYTSIKEIFLEFFGFSLCFGGLCAFQEREGHLNSAPSGKSQPRKKVHWDFLFQKWFLFSSMFLISGTFLAGWAMDVLLQSHPNQWAPMQSLVHSVWHTQHHSKEQPLRVQTICMHPLLPAPKEKEMVIGRSFQSESMIVTHTQLVQWAFDILDKVWILL